ncbi:unnamed protein product, partial [Ectocarpus fasciculatus]
GVCLPPLPALKSRLPSNEAYRVGSKSKDGNHFLLSPSTVDANVDSVNRFEKQLYHLTARDPSLALSTFSLRTEMSFLSPCITSCLSSSPASLFGFKCSTLGCFYR